LRQQGAADTGDDRRDERGGSKQPERQGEREGLGDAQGRTRYQPRDPQNEAASRLKRYHESTSPECRRHTTRAREITSETGVKSLGRHPATTTLKI
jgi:hypothetical protein